MRKLDAISSRLPFIKNLIYFEDDSKANDALLSSSSKWTVASLSEVEKLGKEGPVPPNLPSKDGIALVMYTSGSTGLPKVRFVSSFFVLAALYVILYFLCTFPVCCMCAEGFAQNHTH